MTNTPPIIGGMRLVVGGVPGVGKTTMVRDLAGRLDAKVLNVGDELMAEALRRGVSTNRDGLRWLPMAELDELREAALMKMALATRFVLDSHLLIRKPEGLVAAFQPKWIKLLRLSAMVLVEAPPARILARRAADDGRPRDNEREEDVSSHQDANRQYAERLCNDQGIPMRVANNASTSESSVEAVLAWLNGLVSSPMGKVIP